MIEISAYLIGPKCGWARPTVFGSVRAPGTCLGRTYSAEVPTGRVDGTRTNRDGTPHPYVVLVPRNVRSGSSIPVANPAAWRHQPTTIQHAGQLVAQLRSHGLRGVDYAHPRLLECLQVVGAQSVGEPGRTSGTQI